MKELVRSSNLIDSKGDEHVFSLYKNYSGYSFTWDGLNVDWSFSPHGGYQALKHFEFICDNVSEIDFMNDWVKGD